jgi:hypothetical protein
MAYRGNSEEWMKVPRGGVGAVAQNSYTTSFPVTENPLLEGGIWVRGGSEGGSWTDPQTGPNSSATGQIAFGTQVASPGPPFDDSVAHLIDFLPNHYAEGVIFNAATDQIEVELLVRANISNGSIQLYEGDYVFSGANTCDLHLVRWNGPLNSFTELHGGTAIVTGLDISTGTTHRMSISGNIITFTRNGVSIATYDLLANFVADGSLILSTGNPGMGFWDRSLSSGANRNTMGWSTFSAAQV